MNYRGFALTYFDKQQSDGNISDMSDLETDSYGICLPGKDMLCPVQADIFHSCPGRRQHTWICFRQTASYELRCPLDKATPRCYVTPKAGTHEVSVRPFFDSDHDRR